MAEGSHAVPEGKSNDLHIWELNLQPRSVEDAARKVIAAIQSLSRTARAEWKQCKTRDFNAGIQAGITPPSEVFVLSASSLEGLARRQHWLAGCTKNALDAFSLGHVVRGIPGQPGRVLV